MSDTEKLIKLSEPSESTRLTNSGSYGTFILKCGRVECPTNMSAFEQCYHLVKDLGAGNVPQSAKRPTNRNYLLDIPDQHCHGPPDHGSQDNTARNKLLWAAAVCFLFTIGEAAGGLLANSLAIMTDASHMLSDFASFLISLFALWVARRPATQKMSFGYYRAEVMGAVCSVLIIWVLTGVLAYLAIERMMNMNFSINADTMLITAAAGVAVNIIMGCVLQQSGHGHSHGGLSSNHGHSHDEEDGGHDHDGKKKVNINVRAAFIHVLGDLVQSIGVLIAAVIIKVQPTWLIADPICTILFSVIVLCTTLAILRDALHVLMEGFPRDISYPNLVRDLQNIPGVQMIHSLHVWSLTVDKNALSVHLAMEQDASPEDTLIYANKMLRETYGINQTTVQVEKWQPVMENCHSCQTPTQ
ncbi:proton-coupled zinc antiporter SLC30A2-like [Bolinopsis microptera]|uniref:proton-coupled zinc antiporter SLC30A2-like n=1 Tax=Bolinopsis microptera TaxID=2820187 RepID=UPI00307A8183